MSFGKDVNWGVSASKSNSGLKFPDVVDYSVDLREGSRERGSPGASLAPPGSSMSPAAAPRQAEQLGAREG